MRGFLRKTVKWLVLVRVRPWVVLSYGIAIILTLVLLQLEVKSEVMSDLLAAGLYNSMWVIYGILLAKMIIFKPKLVKLKSVMIVHTEGTDPNLN